MASTSHLISRRNVVAAVGIGLVSQLALRGASTAQPASNARAQPSKLHVVMYEDRLDVDLRLAPFRAGTKYTLAVHSECQLPQTFMVENPKGETIATLQEVPSKQMALLKMTFPEAGTYFFVNKALGENVATPSTGRESIKIETAKT